MRKGIAAALMGLLVSGCAPDIWDRPGATQADFNVDQANCQMFAMGMPQIQPAYVPPTYTANTSYTGTYSNGMANGMATTTVQENNSGQAMANLGAAIGNAIRTKQAMRTCMTARGYTLRPN